MEKITGLAMAIACLAITPSMASAQDNFMDALTGGKVSFSARARYESVNQDNALKNADALTLRTTLGYKTAAFYNFSGFVEFENVSRLNNDTYNDTTNGQTAYSVIADPDATEVNQAYLAYQGFDTGIKLGRQRITYRPLPFNRFIGNVVWRQNHQTFDAISLTNSSIAQTKINYAYINKVHTIFGDDKDAGIIHNGVIDLDAHLVNVQYSGLAIGKLEGYGYFLDYNDAPATSSKTMGLRFTGSQAVNDDWKVLYTMEAANQSDYKSGTMDDQNYYLAELGGKYRGWLAKISYEMQQGDGTYSFKTPLGTNHAYQGWADQFLSTPAQGLQDVYFTVAGKLAGIKLVTAYHDFETDESSLDAGSEFDILAEKTFKQHYTVGMAYADYNASNEFPSKVDTKKFWLYGQLKF